MREGSVWILPVIYFGGLAGTLLPGPAHASQSVPVREIQVIAAQFRFEPNRIEVDQGERIRLIFRSADVTHGFAIPELGLSVRIPEGGAPVAIELVADEAGTFDFGCSEYCGTGHDAMQGQLVVRSTTMPGVAQEDTGSQIVREVDYTIVNVGTTLAVDRHRFAFRVTHRFDRPLGDGGFDDLLADFFALDASALIGLELRFGLFSATQIGAYRTSDRTIQLFGQHRVLDQEAGAPVGLDVALSIEGRDNFQEEYSPSVAIALSRRFGRRTALYAVPRWVGNTNASIDPTDDEQDTFVLGLGARFLIADTVALVGEISPRLGGFDGRRGPDGNEPQASFGVEKLVGRHVFQLNFSNDLGSTPAQVARGQQGPEDWFLGFNISRKF